MSQATEIRELRDSISEAMERIEDSAYSEYLRSWRKFTAKAHSDSSISRKTKELIAVATGLVKGCERCIAYHVRSAYAAGATEDEIVEAGFVAVMMDGGPSLAHFAVLYDAIDEFSPNEGS